jgi:hypothetical protein
VAATWDINGNAILYVDGAQVGSVVHDANNFTGSAVTRLGRPGISARYYSGLMDDVRLYNVTISPNQVQALYYASTGLPAWLAPDSAATWNAGTNTLTVNGAATMVADPGADAPLVVANSAAAALTINPSVDTRVTVGGITLSNGATVTMTDVAAGRVLIVNAGGLSLSGSASLDLADNSMILRGGATLAAVQGLVSAGFHGGDWLGAGGITSSAAAAEPQGRTALGYADNAELGLAEFAGVTGLTGNEILVKYTYYGDSDLSCVVDLDDFSQFLNGYQNPGTVAPTWLNGDFDLSGVIDLDDFSQFLFGYQNQGLPL